jgi:hypothetical protein
MKFKTGVIWTPLSSLPCKYYTRVALTVLVKHSSLLRHAVLL